MKTFTLVYFGTNPFSANLLEKIILDKDLPIDITLVVTQPDRPIGRKQILTPTAVKTVALKYSIPVFEGSIKDLPQQSSDLALLYSYGEFIPTALIECFKYGFWNIHPSLLPKYRNVAPMIYPLLLGDTKTGTTIIQLDTKLDHGPILAQQEVEIQSTDMRADLEIKLTDVSFKLLRTLINTLSMSNDKVSAEPQSHELATYTRMITRNDGFIPFEALKKYLSNESISGEDLPIIITEYYKKYPQQQNINRSSSVILYDLYRALTPWPGIWTLVTVANQERRLRLAEMKITDDKIILTKVQLDGKNEVDFKTFNAAYKLF